MSDADADAPTPATPGPLAFDGVLFFPVTPFGADGGVDHGMLAEHVASRLPFGPGAVFPACGTGEFHALSAREVEDVVRTTVTTVAGRVPVLAGAGGPLGHAIDNARSAEAAGADGLLLLPPYLVSGTTEGLVAYVEAVLAATSLPVVLYHRGTARYTPDAVRRLTAHPQVIGFKDGTGDIGATQEIVLAARATGRELQFFNGLLTAELTQGAFRGIGVPLYSSAAFAMIPELAALHYAAYTAGDEETRLRLLEEFYVPLVRLRDETPGFGVSLIKAGLRLRGLAVGSVRPPLVDPTAEQEARLTALLDAGLALAAELTAAGAAAPSAEHTEPAGRTATPAAAPAPR
ncbi:5-dehydro-4-deoxyglucarate dehydratase [Herbiconiux sp. VKM Ac-1786]|uniref:5-dehydro-4-deoxyglucarate dehydratase n=1 Tax=Herbiconiux sp. VKM Ac-1786 TaxID=2783824 RepID=UPI00188DA4E7|nr:5-dehydro-4-deoxyglucarate dehydratase [Herbiconiux sp. VKM Ac-1786]MBF4574282.1 5-dehydro-4-deoxyglucarate dehydratase [Herbiconiux sp. VKM Ac-1786]